MRKTLVVSLFLGCVCLLFSQPKKTERYANYVSNDTISYVRMLFTGDIEVNPSLMQSAKTNSGQYDFSSLFYNIRPILGLGDLVLGNFEGNFSGKPYAEKPLKNAPVEFAYSLKNAGFNFLVTANQSALRIKEQDFEQKQTMFDNFSLLQTGTFKDKANRNADYPKVITKKGLKIAILNYVDGFAYLDGLVPLINGFSEQQIIADLEKANQMADFVIVYFNWGSILEPIPNKQQYYLASVCAQNGADLVLGSHPKVAQSVFLYEKGVYGEKPCFANFSLGHLLNTERASSFDSYIMEAIVSKHKVTGEVKVESYGFIPLWMLEYQKNGNLQYTLLPVSQVENGSIKVMLDYKEFFEMLGAAVRVRNKIGSGLPEIQYNVSTEVIRDANEFVAITGKPVNETEIYNQKLALKKAYELAGRDIEKPERTIITEDERYFSIRFLTLYRKISIDTEYYKHLKGYKIVKHNNQYLYLIGQTAKKQEAENLLLDIKRNGHAYAEIIEFKNGEIVE